MDSLTFSFVIDPGEQLRATQALTRRQRFAWIFRWGWIVFALPVLFAIAGDVPLRVLWPYAVLVAIMSANLAHEHPLDRLHEMKQSQ